MKPLTTYAMHFKTRWCNLSAALLALAFFLRVIYFTVLSDYTQVSTATIVFRLIIPLLLCIAGILLLRVIRLQHPLVYAITAALLCLMIMFGNLSSGNTLRIIFSVLWYLVCCAALITTALGYIPWKLPASFAVATPLAIRFIAYDRGLSKGEWIMEISALCILAAVFCITRCIRQINANT